MRKPAPQSNRRVPQVAPFPGAGADVQNAALGGALDPNGGIARPKPGPTGALYPPAPRVVTPPAGPAQSPPGMTPLPTPPGGLMSEQKPPSGMRNDPYWDSVFERLHPMSGSSAAASAAMPRPAGGASSIPRGGMQEPAPVGSTPATAGTGGGITSPGGPIDQAPPAGGAPAPAPGSNMYRGGGSSYHAPFGAEYDLDKSAKGTFLAATAPVAEGDLGWMKSETAGAWFDKYVRPQMEARGYKVGEVKGDKAFVHTRENPEGTWIDWVEGVDGPNPRLTWQDQSYMGDVGMGAAAPSNAPLTDDIRPTDLTGLGAMNPSNPNFYQQLLAYLMQQLKGA